MTASQITASQPPILFDSAYYPLAAGNEGSVAGRADVMDFASRIPADVTSAVLGFPLKRFADMLDAIERAFHIDPGEQDNDQEVAQAFEEIVEYGRELIVDKRRNPGDDLTCLFIEARDGEDRLTEDELVSLVTLMIMAGID
jgi:cytochrome P450